MIRLQTPALTLILSAAALVAGGCNDQPKPMPYGTGVPSSAPDASMTPPPTVVPAGAQRLSQGTYNQIQFTVPPGNGSLFVFDVDQNKVVGVTNSVASESGKSMTMADLKNTAQGLSMTDQYQVFYAPTLPTTRPIGGGM